MYERIGYNTLRYIVGKDKNNKKDKKYKDKKRDHMKVNIVIDIDKADFKDNVLNAIDTLDTIIANANVLDAAQVRQAIGKLATYQKKIIKRLVQVL